MAERYARLEAPPGSRPQLHFHDRSNGYAMFVNWEAKPAVAVLYGTKDGGQTWTKLDHPYPEAEEHQIHVLGKHSVGVLADKVGGNWISHDSGASWKKAPNSGYQGYERYHLDFGPNYDGPTTIRDTERADFKIPVPAGYEHGNLSYMESTGAAWLSALRDGVPITAISRGGVDDFKPVPVPEQAGRDLLLARVMVGGGDTWLVAEQDAPGSSSGPTGMVVLKGTGLPLVWQLVGDAWVARPFAGIKEDPGWFYSAAPVGDGKLLVTGPDQIFYFDGQRHEAVGVPKLSYVNTLADGTVMGTLNLPDLLYLGEGTGTQRTWIRVQVSRR